MAKNWTMAEAIKAIAEQNAEDVKDIYKRFPTAAMLMTRAVAGDCEAACNIIASLPEWATVNKFEKAIKVEVNDSDDADVESDDEDDVDEDKPTPKAKTKAAAKETKTDEDSDYASMSGREMKIMLRKAGKLKDLKAKGFGTTKADMQAYLEKYGLDGAEADEDEVEADVEVETETEAEESKYASLSAQELFKECKRRKLEVKPKRSVKYYVDILEKNDAEQADDSDEDEDWDDEPEIVEEKPKAKSKKPAKKTEKPAKKPAKVDEAEDEDEDWDI